MSDEDLLEQELIVTVTYSDGHIEEFFPDYLTPYPVKIEAKRTITLVSP